jgi:nucleoside-diphosphate-sugar epimerase
MRVLVTGHRGYIGSILAPMLLEAGHEVTGLDSDYYRGCDLVAPTAVAVASVRDVRDVTPADVAGFDAVVHLAALSNDPVGDLNSAWTYEINRDGTVVLAQAAKAAGVPRFVFASSCSMYGAAGSDAPLDERSPLRPLTPYAESKVRAEEALQGLAAADFAPVSMRNATVYGASPRLRLDIVLNNLVAWAHTTGAIRLQSDGSPWRPLVHVADVARATLALLEAPADQVAGEAFNIGSAEQNYRIRELAETVQDRFPNCAITFAEGASPDPRSYRVDFSKFSAAFPDFRFQWTAARGVDELADAYEAYGLTLDGFQGHRFVRLNQLKRLLDSGELDGELRWSAVEASL